jgi:putative Mg2+ transporter-C (MgtC) family protein
MLFGSVIGAERELARKPAGFRTHMLVAGAAALLVGLGSVLMGRFADRIEGGLSGDPIRIVQAVVLGISFLGTGTIVRRPGSAAVEGLTTGAALLFSGAIGIAVALRQFWVAGGCTVLVALVLRLVGRIEDRLERR